MKLDGIAVRARFDVRYPNNIYLETAPHGEGTVDVVVSNPDGQLGRLISGYTFVPPQSFDFNGTWAGFPNDGSDREVRFTIQNNTLVSISCESSTLAVTPPFPVANGAFSFQGIEGIRISGKIVSASEAVGSINMSPCVAPLWRAGLT